MMYAFFSSNMDEWSLSWLVWVQVRIFMITIYKSEREDIIVGYKSRQKITWFKMFSYNRHKLTAPWSTNGVALTETDSTTSFHESGHRNVLERDFSSIISFPTNTGMTQRQFEEKHTISKGNRGFDPLSAIDHWPFQISTAVFPFAFSTPSQQKKLVVKCNVDGRKLTPLYCC